MNIKWKGDHQYSIQVVLNAPKSDAVAVYMIDGSVRCVISKILYSRLALFHLFVLRREWMEAYKNASAVSTALLSTFSASGSSK